MEIDNSSPLPSGFEMRPWLIQAHGSCKDAHTLVDIPDRSLHEVIFLEMQGNICLVCVYDDTWLLIFPEIEMQGNICLGCIYDGTWLLLVDEATLDCSLLSVTSHRRPKISLPPLAPTTDCKGATCGVLGSSAMAESEQNFLLCCRTGDEEWTDLMTADADCIRFFGTIVIHAGKLYAGDLVVMDVTDGNVRLFHLGISSAC